MALGFGSKNGIQTETSCVEARLMRNISIKEKPCSTEGITTSQSSPVREWVIAEIVLATPGVRIPVI